MLTFVSGFLIGVLFSAMAVWVSEAPGVIDDE